MEEKLQGRCRVCALPLPAGGQGDDICSRRCAGLRRESARVFQDREQLASQLLAAVAELRTAATMCPGELSQRVLPDLDRPLTVLRPVLFGLAASGRIRLSQKGTWVPWVKIRGPFRVGRGK